jgi:twinkle protein
MLRQFSGESLDDPLTHDRAGFITKMVDRMDKFLSDKMYLYDQQGTTTPEKVIAMSRYCAIELKVKHIVIDSLMKCVTGEDDYNAQKSFVDELTALARDHNIHIHLVHHIRKLGSEEIQPSKTDIKGSGAIADQVDNVLLMWRNKKKEHDIQNGQIPDHKKPDALLMCEKQRNGEAEEWYSLWFNRDSQQFVDESGGMPMSFDDRGAF